MELDWKPIHDPKLIEQAKQIIFHDRADKFPLTPDDRLSILERNGFGNPRFYSADDSGIQYNRCMVTGPDQKQYSSTQVWMAILMFDLFDRLYQDRGAIIRNFLNSDQGPEEVLHPGIFRFDRHGQ